MIEKFEKTGHAVVNTDSHGRESYLRQRRLMEGKDSELNEMKAKMSVMCDEMVELKYMLSTLLSRI